jgi:hypothetical protein
LDQCLREPRIKPPGRTWGLAHCRNGHRQRKYGEERSFHYSMHLVERSG